MSTAAQPQEKTATAPRPGGLAEIDGTKLRALLAAIRDLSGELSLDVLLSRAMEAVTSLVESDRSSLFIYDHESNELWSKIAQGLDTLELRFPATEGLAGRAARTGEIINVPDAYQNESFNREFDRKTGYRTRSVVCVPMKDAHGHVLGVIQALNKTGNRPFTDADIEMLSTLGGHIAAFIENAQLYESIERLFEDVVRTIATAIDERDPATAGHTKRVAKYAINIARAAHREGLAEYTRPRLRQLRYAALLHDVGKIGVRESVLLKKNRVNDDRMELIAERLRRLAIERGEPGTPDGEIDFLRGVNAPGFLKDEDAERLKRMESDGLITPEESAGLSVRRGNLTPEEWADMRSHADRSLHILGTIHWPEDLVRIPEIAHRHHEKLDGSGYPRGLKAEEIDMDARILEVADIYDALTARDRPYKPAIPHERACVIVREEAAGGKLDSRLVELFLGHNLHEIELSGETQIIGQAG